MRVQSLYGVQHLQQLQLLHFSTARIEARLNLDSLTGIVEEMERQRQRLT